MQRPFSSHGSSSHSFTSASGGETETEEGEQRKVECDFHIEVPFPLAETVHFPGPALLYRHSSVMGPSPVGWSRGLSQGLQCEVRDHGTMAALWTPCSLLSGIKEQVNINKRILFILAHLISQGFCAV